MMSDGERGRSGHRRSVLLKRTRWWIVALVALVGAMLPGRSAMAERGHAMPTSMAAVGDSITRAFDACCYYGDHLGQSWSTGDGWWDPIRSHYERIRAVNPAIAGRFYNYAENGARMASAPAQVGAAVSQGVDYVTILLGANDLCTSSPSTMTATQSFHDSFTAALTALDTGLPKARVFVSSIPDIYRLWQVLHTSWWAQAVWAYAGICPAMLSSSNTEADRQQVVARETEFNQVLADVCAQFKNCVWDGGAV
jgi:lysophospholipase L1-like esterase